MIKWAIERIMSLVGSGKDKTKIAKIVEVREKSAEEKCIEAAHQLRKDQRDKEAREKRWQIAKQEHYDRIDKILDLIKNNPDECFNGKLLAEKLPAKDIEEKIFFEKFSYDSMYFGGYGVPQFYSFLFFKHKGEEFFKYNPQKD